MRYRWKSLLASLSYCYVGILDTHINYCAVVAMFGSVFVPCFVIFSIMASFSDLYMLVDILLPLFARSTAGISLTQFMYGDF